MTIFLIIYLVGCLVSVCLCAYMIYVYGKFDSLDLTIVLLMTSSSWIFPLWVLKEAMLYKMDEISYFNPHVLWERDDDKD